MIIKGKGFLLRPARKEDADSLWENYNDKEVARGMATMETEKQFKKEWKEGFKKKDKNSDRFVIEIDERAVGKITMKMFDPYNKSKAKISYWIGKGYRGKGITSLGVKLAVGYWFKKFKLVRIEARARTYNKASARVLEKAGFKLEGIMRKNIFKDGKHYDDCLYARVK